MSSDLTKEEDQLDMLSEESALMTLAKDLYSSSTDYLDSSVRRRVEKSTAHFHNRHADDSKFNSPNYKKRNRMFHPKSRNGVRSSEAGFAAAMFSTSDLASVSAFNDNDERQQASAEIHQELLNYRLEHSIKWFLTCMGAFQDSQVNGICASYNYWKYEERTVKELVPYTDEYGQQFYGEDNQPLMQEIERANVCWRYFGKNGS